MDEVLLGLLLGVLLLGLPMTVSVVAFVALRRTKRLQGKVIELERAVERLRADRGLDRTEGGAARLPTDAQETPTDAASPRDAADAVETVSVEADAATPLAPTVSVDPSAPGEAAARTASIGPRVRPQITAERAAMWVAAGLGGLSVLLAALFSLSAAIDRGWMGPAVRIGLGLTVGMGAWWGGTLARARQLTWVGSALVGAGVAVLCGTLYAGNVLYDLMGTPITFGLLAVVSVVALWTGVRQGSRFDAWLGLIGGLATPLLVQATEPRPLVLYGYLGVLVAGTLAAAARRGWTELIIGAALGFMGFFVAWTAQGSRPVDQPIALGVVAFLGLVCVLAERWAVEHRHSRSTVALAGVFVSLLAVLWSGPSEPLFIDPFTGMRVFQPSPHGPWVAAIGVLAVLAPVVMGPRTLGARRLSGGLAVVLVGAFALHHAQMPAVPWLPLATVLGAVPLMGLVPRDPSEDPRASAVWLLPVASGLGAAVALYTSTPDATGVLATVLVVLGAGLVLALGRGAPILFLPALLATCLPLTVAAERTSELGPTVVAGPAALAFGLFATLPLRKRSADPRTTVAAALAGPALFLPLYRAWEAAGGVHMIGLLPVAMGVVTLVGTLTLVRQFGVRRDSGALALFVAVTLLGLTAAIPLQLQDQWLTVAWALEGVAVAWASRRLDHRLLRWTAVLLGLAVTVRLVANPWALEYATTGGPVFFNWTLYTWGLPAATLVGTAWLLGPSLRRDRVLVPALARLGLLLCAVGVGFALVNVQVSHAFQDSGPIELGGQGIWQGMVRSLAWAGYGMLILAAGTKADHRVVRMVGFFGVLAAAGKVFLFDLWSLSGFVRVGSIAGLGVTLLMAAFVFERLVLRRAARDEGEGQ